MEKIRITSGNLRGRTIKSPRSNLTHPMGAREKLALFNMIAMELPGAMVLDAFAGSGALGIEALSRGAGGVVFVEKNTKVARIIAENLGSLGLEGEIISSNARSFESKKMFDIIIADPPYDNFNLNDIIYLTKYLKNGGVFVLSHPGATPVISGLELTKSHKYAGATLSIFKK